MTPTLYYQQELTFTNIPRTFGTSNPRISGLSGANPIGHNRVEGRDAASFVIASSGVFDISSTTQSPPNQYKMFGLAGRRTALARSKCLAPTALPARAIAATQAPSTNTRDFHSTPTNAAFRPTWMPMRVKTPWIDALTQSREAARESKDGAQAAPSITPDLTPKKMSDSYYSAVCLDLCSRYTQGQY